MGAATAPRAYERPLKTVSLFKYLGRLLTETDKDWLAIISNLCNHIKIWSQLARILGQEKADTRLLRRFYISVV